MSTKAKITSGPGEGERAPERRVAAPAARPGPATHARAARLAWSRGLETRECVFDAPLGTTQPGR